MYLNFYFYSKKGMNTNLFQIEGNRFLFSISFKWRLMNRMFGKTQRLIQIGPFALCYFI